MFDVDGKFAGRSKAIVLDNIDPLSRGRIRVRHPILGDTVWIDYLNAPNQFDVPSVGDIVYLECDAGYDTHPIAHGRAIKGADSSPMMPEVFKRTNPTNRGFYTPGGHLIEFDDGTGPTMLDKGMRFTTSGGIKVHLLEGTPIESKVLIEMPGGAKLELDGFQDMINAEVAFGDKINISKLNGIQMSTPALGGTSVSMKAGKIDVLSALAQTYTSDTGSITIKAGQTMAELTQTAITLKEPIGGTLKLTQGKVALGSSVAETLALMEQAIKSLTDNAATFVNTAVGPGVLSPAIVAILQQVLILLGQIKGTV